MGQPVQVKPVAGNTPPPSFQFQMALKSALDNETPLLMLAGKARPLLESIITRGEEGTLREPALVWV